MKCLELQQFKFYYPSRCIEGAKYDIVDIVMDEQAVHRIAKEAAKEAIKELGLTTDDVKDIKSLVKGVRVAGNEALKTFVRIAIIGLCILGGIKYIGM